MKRLFSTLFIALIIFASFFVRLGNAFAESSQSVIREFNFISCGKTECLKIHSPKAWISLSQGGFTTGEDAVIEWTNLKGEVLKSLTAESASFNTDINSISIESKTAFFLYSLSDGQTSEFHND